MLFQRELNSSNLRSSKTALCQLLTDDPCSLNRTSETPLINSGSDCEKKICAKQQKYEEVARTSAYNRRKSIDNLQSRNKFECLTEVKNITSRIKEGVNSALSEAENALQVRREKLRDMLLTEEYHYAEEYKRKVEECERHHIDEMQKDLRELKLKEEAERRALAEEKRLQQFRERCDELRLKVHNRNRKMLSNVHELQIKDKLAQEKREKEQEIMYSKLIEKDVQEMKEHEKKMENERQHKLKEIAKMYEQQLEEKKLIEKEQQRIRKEEAKLADELRVQLQQEKEAEKEKESKARQQRREEMEEQLKQARELQELREAQEKEIDKAFSEGIQNELHKEKTDNIDQKRQMRREMELFRAYLDEKKFEEEQSKAKVMQLRQKEIERIEMERCKIKMQADAAKEELRQQVIKERARQLEEKQIASQEERERKTLEDRKIMKECEEFQVMEKERKLREASKRKMYGKALKEQEIERKLVEQNKRQEEENQLKKDLMLEEHYLKSAEQLFNCETTSTKKHPFMRKFEFC